jgi:hypothetical protein
MAAKREITRDDIVSIEAYAADRKQIKAKIVETKKHRRLEVGPVATFYFENYETMWLQVHEMLYIERGGEEQIEDELSAYNPLIPKGEELVATIMFEIDDPIRRQSFLAKLGGVEETVFIRIGEHEVRGVPEADVDRTTAAGKASSVQFVHFPFNAEAKAAFRSPGAQVVVGFTHPEYAHMTVMPEAVREALSGDFG